MNEPVVLIPLNLIVILRLFGGLCWGFAWAAFLQFHKVGKIWVEQRTWLTVLIGVGVDFAISYPENWYVSLGVVAASSIGILIRSWHNEVNPDFRKRIMPNKSLWSLDNADALCLDIIQLLSQTMESGEIPEYIIQSIAKAMSRLNRIRIKIKDARNGEYHE